MTDTPVVATAEVETPAKAPPTPRRRGAYDIKTGTVTVVEPNVTPDVAYKFGSLPDAVQAHVALHGMWMLMRAAETPAAGYASLLKGELVAVKAPVVEELSDWKKAVAASFVELTTKHGAPMSQEDALAKAATLDRKQMAAARLDPMVIRHHNKIAPVVGGSSLTAILNPPALVA